MPEIPFRSPISGAPVASPDGSLALTDESAAPKVLVKAGHDPLGVRFAHSATRGDALVMGIRPGEWMAIGRADVDVPTGEGTSVIDATHVYALLRLTGAESTRLLEKLCSVDLTDAMTPDGAVFSAPIAEVRCDVVRDDRDGSASYVIACDRSLGQSLFDALAHAGEELGLPRRDTAH